MKPRSPKSPRIKPKSVHKVVERNEDKSDDEQVTGAFETSYHNTKWYPANLKFSCPLTHH